MDNNWSTLAIAELDAKGLGYGDKPDTRALRETYPELAFIFDLVDMDVVAASEHADLKEDFNRLDTYASNLEDCIDRVDQLSSILSRLDSITKRDFAQLIDAAEDLTDVKRKGL